VGSGNKGSQVWNLAFLAEPDVLPEWLLELAEAVGGYELTSHAVPVVAPEAFAVIEKTSKVLANDTGTKPYTSWARWFLSDRAKRTIPIYPEMPSQIGGFSSPRPDPATD
jgi:hypothetical protein